MHVNVLLKIVSSYVVIVLRLAKFYLQVCERSLTSSTGGPTGPPPSSFVRAEMLASGFLIRPCEGGGSIIHIVDHVDLDVRIRYSQIIVVLLLFKFYMLFEFSIILLTWFYFRLGAFLKF